MQVLSLLTLALLSSAQATAAPSQQPPPPPAQITPSIPTPDASGVYQIGHGVLPPKLTSSVEPEYSEEARKAKISADCTVALIIDAKGQPRDLQIVHSAAEGQSPKKQHAAATLDPEALDAIAKYKFAPATLNGEPVPVMIHVQVNFRIYDNRH